MRRLSVSILAGLVALSLVFVGACGEPSSTPTPTPTPTETPSATPAEPVVIKFADLSAPGSSRTKVMQWFCDEVESRTDGRVTFEIYWSSGLVKGKEMLDGVSSGLTDFGHLVAFYFPDDLPVSNVAAMPFLTGDVYAMLHANKDLFDHPALVEEQERHNMKYLLAAGAPSYNLFMTDGFVKNLEDLQGKRIRSFGAFAKALTMLGATTLSIDTGETYDALVRGVADGAMNSVYGGLAHKWNEPASYLTIAQIGCLGAVYDAINLDTWNKISPEDQAIIEEVADEFTDRLAQSYQDEYATNLDEIKAAGGSVYDLPPDEVKRWQAAAAPIHEEWVSLWEEKGYPASEVYDEFMRLIKKYETEH